MKDKRQYLKRQMFALKIFLSIIFAIRQLKPYPRQLPADMPPLYLASISLRLKDKAVVGIRRAFNLLPRQRRVSPGVPRVFSLRPPPFDFPPFPDSPFPPRLVHFHQSPVTFILSRTDSGGCTGSS